VIRPAVPADTPRLVQLTEGTGFFKPHDLETLRGVLDAYHETNHDDDHHALTSERDGLILGYAYFAKVAMTAGTWMLWWIAVDKATQARGVGGELLAHVEDDIRARGGRLLLIETSSTELYAPTRKFYLKHDYSREAQVRDYYADGDGLVVFRKRLQGTDAPG
jgi:ribosomal protein S18 acetylase RimI-like enzyme